MNIWVAQTDKNWFDFLSKLKPDEVNFWQPSPKRLLKLQPGDLFLFKLKKGFAKIVGGGFFVKNASLPLSLVWDSFKENNGIPNLSSFLDTVLKYHIAIKYHKHNDSGESDPRIGCNILSNPFFLNENEWITLPEVWSYNIVKGKKYSTKEPLGKILLNQVISVIGRNKNYSTSEIPNDLENVGKGLYGSEYLTRARIGQGTFRVLVAEAYQERCAITGEKTLPALESAHIKNFGIGPNTVNNGLLLRADIHKLFDKGFITITKQYKVEVSERIKKLYKNGKEYYSYHGKSLVIIPTKEIEKPSLEYIEWHNLNKYIS